MIMPRLPYLLTLLPVACLAQTPVRRSIHVRIVGDTTWTESVDGSAVRTVQRGDTLWELRTGFPGQPDRETRWVINGPIATRESPSGTVVMSTELATMTRRYALKTAALEARLRARHIIPDP